MAWHVVGARTCQPVYREIRPGGHEPRHGEWKSAAQWGILTPIILGYSATPEIAFGFPPLARNKARQRRSKRRAIVRDEQMSKERKPDGQPGRSGKHAQDQGIIRDERGQEQPLDKERAQR